MEVEVVGLVGPGVEEEKEKGSAAMVGVVVLEDLRAYLTQPMAADTLSPSGLWSCRSNVMHMGAASNVGGTR